MDLLGRARTVQITVRDEAVRCLGVRTGRGPAGCSARGCRADATTALIWRNPKLHDAAREKHWLACDEHADHLADFLARRGFLLGREPLDDPQR